MYVSDQIPSARVNSTQNQLGPLPTRPNEYQLDPVTNSAQIPLEKWFSERAFVGPPLGTGGNTLVT